MNGRLKKECNTCGEILFTGSGEDRLKWCQPMCSFADEGKVSVGLSPDVAFRTLSKEGHCPLWTPRTEPIRALYEEDAKGPPEVTCESLTAAIRHIERYGCTSLSTEREVDSKVARGSHAAYRAGMIVAAVGSAVVFSLIILLI